MKKLLFLLSLFICSFSFAQNRHTKGNESSQAVFDAMHYLGYGQGDTVSAINKAIQDAALVKGIVVLPEGTVGIANAYRSGTAYRPLGIIGASNVTLRGAGLGQTILVQDAPPAGATFDTTSLVTNTHWASIITCTNCTNFRVENLSINGTLSRQINHTGNPYTNDAIADSSRVDAIRITGGINNSIYNIRIDSIQFYGTSTTGGYQTTIDHIIATTCIQGGVYFTGVSSGSVLSNSLVTNNNCDNVRIRSGNITVINNEVSWAKFNPSAVVGGGANFAGIYVEDDGGSLPQTVGINVTNNRIHDNSSYGVDAFNVDTVNWSFTGPTVSIRNNEIYRNANGGVQVQMQWLSVDGNDIYENGADSTGRSDATAGKSGVATHGTNSNGLSVTNNTFKSTSPNGVQLYGIAMGSATAIPIFSVHGNKQFGGLDLLGITTASLKTTAPYNTYYGNTLMDSNKVTRSSWTTDQNGALYMYNYVPGLGGTASGTLNLVSDLDANFSGIHLGNTTRAFYIAGNGSGLGAELGFKIGSYGVGAGTIAGRQLGFYDFQTSAVDGAVNSSGDFYWGTPFLSTAPVIFHQLVANLGLNPQTEFIATGTGSSAGQQQIGFKSTFKAGYTGTGGLAIATYSLNSNVANGGTIGNAGIGHANYGSFNFVNGASTGSGGTAVGVFSCASGSLRSIGGVFDGSYSQYNNAGAISGGIIGFGLRTNASAIEFGGYFGLQGGSEPTFASAAVIADNGAETVPVALFRVNGTTKVQVTSAGDLSVATGNALLMPEGSNGRVGQVALVAGTKAITISGLTTSSRGFVQLVSQGGTVTTTVGYEVVCTSNTLTISAVTSAGSNALNNLDTSTLNYFVIN